MTDAPDARYEEALARHGLDDVQPLYRRLLIRLKAEDPAAYDSAVDRYRNNVEKVNAGPDAANPLETWLAYGRWLAERLAAGSVIEIRANGRADPAGETPRPGSMLVHLPDDGSSPGFLLTMPTSATDAQRETAALICDG